jgi:hypothetical protein
LSIKEITDNKNATNTKDKIQVPKIAEAVPSVATPQA